MKYKITMRKSYNLAEFIFNTLTGATSFMLDALDHSNGEISFIVEAITEEENTEAITEEEENADEE